VQLPSKLTVEIDTREQHPLSFPATITVRDPFDLTTRVIGLTTRKATLPTGDYRIAEYTNLCIVERKATVQELYSNLLGTDRHRAGRAFVRLTRSCAHPTILLEATPASFFNPTPPLPGNPDILLSWMQYTVARMKLNLLWLPWGSNAKHRTRLGTVVAQHLTSYVLLHLTYQRLNSLTDPERVPESERGIPPAPHLEDEYRMLPKESKHAPA